MLPGFVLMLGLSVLYVEAELSGNLDELFYGLKAAVVAIIARALVRLSQTFITDVPLAVLAVGAFALTVFADAGFVIVLLGAGLLYELWSNARSWLDRSHSLSLGLPGVLGLLVGAITVSLTAEIFWEGLKAGLVTFGGAFTVIPYLHDVAVQGKGWLTEGQFVDGLAIGGVLPAPLIIFSTFVGYIAGGLAGGLAMTVGIFIPAFVFPIFFHRQLVAIAENERLHPFLLGVAAGVIGLIAAVTVDIIDTGVVDVATALLAVAGFLVLNRWHGKLTVLYVVLGCGVVGAVLQLTVLCRGWQDASLSMRCGSTLPVVVRSGSGCPTRSARRLRGPHPCSGTSGLARPFGPARAACTETPLAGRSRSRCSCRYPSAGPRRGTWETCIASLSG